MQFGRWRVGGKEQIDLVGHLCVSQAFSAKLLVQRLACLYRETDLQASISAWLYISAEYLECERVYVGP